MQVVHLLREGECARLRHRHDRPERVPEVVAVLRAQPELGLERHLALRRTVHGHRADRVVAGPQRRHRHGRLDQVDALKVGQVVVARLDVVEARQRVDVLAVDREHLQVAALGPRLLATVLDAPRLTETAGQRESECVSFNTSRR